MNRPSLGGLLASRMGSLLLALLCAVVAGVLVLFALSRVKTNVTQPLPQATALIARGTIHKGESGANIVRRHLYKATPVTSAQLAPGAISDASVLTNATALSTVSPGQQLTAADFGTVVGVDQTLHGDQRAVEISTSGAPGATDITQVDSRVDIWAKVGGRDVLIAPNVLVMKPATAAAVTIGNQTVGGTNVVLRVPTAIVSAVLTNAAGLYFVLRPATGATSSATSATTTSAASTTSTTTGATP